MEQREIFVADQVDAKLAINAMRRRDRLWRTAQGRTGWAELFGFLSALLLVAIGLIELGRSQGFREFLDAKDGLFFVLLGVVLLGGSLWSHTQRQINAVLELVKRLEVERSTR